MPLIDRLAGIDVQVGVAAYILGLRWATQGENVRSAVRIRASHLGERIPMKRLWIGAVCFCALAPLAYAQRGGGARGGGMGNAGWGGGRGGIGRFDGNRFDGNRFGRSNFNNSFN